MEDISIITTNYPNEYIISSLYGKHATISSVYPDGVNTKTYKITNKRKEDLASQEKAGGTGIEVGFGADYLEDEEEEEEA